MSEAQLADAILRKISAGWEHCIIVERYENGGIGGLIDTTWFSLTPEEANYLDSLPQS